MADTNALITIKDLVKEAILQAKRPKSDYHRFFQFCINGYRELRTIRNELTGIKEVKLTPSAINTITLPSDYLKLVGVCVPVNGKYYYLTSENELITTTTLVDGEETQDANVGEGTGIGVEYSGYASRGGVNQAGYYKVDENNWRINLINTTFGEVILRYISSGTSLTDTTYIHVRLKAPLIAYIIREDVMYTNPEMYQQFHNMYRHRLEELSAYTMPTLKELKDIFLSLNYPLPKR